MRQHQREKDAGKSNNTADYAKRAKLKRANSLGPGPSIVKSMVAINLKEKESALVSPAKKASPNSDGGKGHQQSTDVFTKSNPQKKNKENRGGLVIGEPMMAPRPRHNSDPEILSARSMKEDDTPSPVS
jgi:hypothetical protein